MHHCAIDLVCGACFRLKTLLGPLDAIFQRPETTIMERLKVNGEEGGL